MLIFQVNGWVGQKPFEMMQCTSLRTVACVRATASVSLSWPDRSLFAEESSARGFLQGYKGRNGGHLLRRRSGSKYCVLAITSSDLLCHWQWATIQLPQCAYDSSQYTSSESVLHRTRSGYSARMPRRQLNVSGDSSRLPRCLCFDFRALIFEAQIFQFFRYAK
ncbi:hypothetical protein BC827DRAFT_260582 [Russula dissimulans]|nr:hypothetical protein BC827DRAFT_260582 [Russula dissimulans]